jgi:uncharacterized protein YbaR (Trm112 family)
MSGSSAWQDFEQSESDILIVCCPSCQSPLTLHQPDEELADRLLAICEDCKSWFLTNGVASVLTLIPEASDNSL